MIVSFGDFHLQTTRPWSVDVGWRLVDDILKSPLNAPGNTGVFLGDLTEHASIDGVVFSMLMALFSGAKFDNLIILRGNHDGEKVDNKVYATFDFLKEVAARFLFKTPIRVIEEPTVLTIEGIQCLFLPHLFGETPEHCLVEYEKDGAYSSLLAHAGQEWDIVFGHFTNQMRTEPGRKYNISYVKSKFFCFGHNHNPGPGYQGSHIPNTIAEANKDRQVRTYRKEDATVLENILPARRILDYYNVKFPDALPAVDSDVAVWTVYECQEEAIARANYGRDIYIRRCIYDLSQDSASFDRQSMLMVTQEGKQITVQDMFEAWVKTAGLDSEVEKETRSYLNLAIT